ncbi:MAG: FAD-dependent oxidoreductase [Betaproteobacteria bacterium]|nr:FAD-dependent oxidoreductase [Betaproteobacteria bacterium]
MKTQTPIRKIAVIGSGISGLSAAWLLSQQYEVTLFEAGEKLGGHTNTVDVTVDGVTHPVDTGFLVFNHKTYPNLTALFAQLEVASVETEMSFAVSLESPDLEWAGSSLATVFGQKRNLARPAFWRMLADILRFNRESIAWLDAGPDERLSLRDYLQQNGYSRAFTDWYLLPMGAAIWSCPADSMLDYPLATFVRFCRNHGLLQVFDRPLWRTVQGGGREYVRKLAAQIGDEHIRLATPVRRVERCPEGVRLTLADGVETFDQVVLACHSDQALHLLGSSASDGERELLSAIRYQPNRAVLHTDSALLPRNRSLWSAWNYSAGTDAGANVSSQSPVSVSYLINRLQPLPFETPVVVSLNPQREPNPEKVLAEFTYAHPLFDGPAIAAQARLHEIQGVDRLWFCGAWGGYGFHEDGLRSGLQVAAALGCQAPWQKPAMPLDDALAPAVVAMQ